MATPGPHATIHYAGADLFVGVTPSGHALTLDTNHDRNSAPTPMELLLVALGACTAIDVIGILQKKRERVTDYRVEVSGQRREDHPRKYEVFRVHHIVKGHGVSEKSVAKAVELSETKYCSVAATLRPAADILTTCEVIDEGSL